MLRVDLKAFKDIDDLSFEEELLAVLADDFARAVSGGVTTVHGLVALHAHQLMVVRGVVTHDVLVEAYDRRSVDRDPRATGNHNDLSHATSRKLIVQQTARSCQ
jgi:hypothetical protein